VAHLTLLQTGDPEAVLEEHVRHVGAAGVRLATLAGRVPFGPAQLKGLLDALQAAGRVIAVDRDWFIHPESFARLSTLVVETLTAFHRAGPLKPGMSREELRSRAGGADERVFAFLLSALGADGTVKTERDKVRLASHEVRLSPDQQRIIDRLEDDFLRAEAAPPSAEEALGRAGLGGDEEHELFQVLVQAGKLVRVKESLFFHARALDTIQTKLVALLRERKEIGPADIKDLLGISRKYAIPLLEFFDQRRVTARVGERRILRAG
jgi:selenocysteine-specific elongation factor